MIDVHIPEPLEGTESKRMIIKVIKAKDNVEIETSAFPIEVYDEALALGFQALLNRGQSKITGTSIPDDDERAAESAKVAEKTLADMYAGKIRRTSGVKSAKGARGEVAVEARRLAKFYVKEQLKEEGLRVSLIKPAVITRLAQELLDSDPDVTKEAEANVAARKGKGKTKKKIDLSKIAEDEDLVGKAKARGKSRKKVDEEDEEAPPPRRGGFQRREANV
jgi:hypothetical protein